MEEELQEEFDDGLSDRDNPLTPSCEEEDDEEKKKYSKLEEDLGMNENIDQEILDNNEVHNRRHFGSKYATNIFSLKCLHLLSLLYLQFIWQF